MSRESERRNERARELGYRNDYDRRTWERPVGSYWEVRAEGYADQKNTSFEQEYGDKNSGYWQAWREAAKEGYTVMREGKWVAPLTYDYRSAYYDWLVESGFVDPDDDRDSFGETDSAT